MLATARIYFICKVKLAWHHLVVSSTPESIDELEKRGVTAGFG